MWRNLVRGVLVVTAVVISHSSYSVSNEACVQGVPLPFIVFEKSADGNSLLPFTSPLSVVLIPLDIIICVGAMWLVDRWALSRCFRKSTRDK